MVLRISGFALLPFVTGMLPSASSESIWYCGVWTAIWYATRLVGSSQKFGDVWKLPESEISRLLATSRSEKPASCDLVRSTLTWSFGWSKGCCMRRSTMPSMRLRLSISFNAWRRLPSRSRPTIWMSIGAGRPKFRIWLTMSAGRNAKLMPGNSATSFCRRSCTYCSVGRCPSSKTRGCPRPRSRPRPNYCTRG